MKKFIKNYQNIIIEAQVIEAGEDLCIIITGGEKPHIGSVSISIPRPSLADPKLLSATTSTYNFLGHKDDAIGNMISKKIASTLNRKVVVTCGIHLDNISDNQISYVYQVSEMLLKELMDYLQLQ